MVVRNKPERLWAYATLIFAISVSVQGAEPDSVSKPLLHCVVTPSAVVDVASGVGGRVESIEVERGDRVDAGQRIAALDSGVEKANLVLAQARADLEAEIHLREVRFGFQERSRARTEKLHTSRVVSAHERDEAKTDAVLASWQLRQAVDNQRLARLELNRAEEVVKRRLVHSPIQGVVVERFKSPGEYVEEEPVVRVARLDPLWVEVVVPVSLRGTIRRNMLAEVATEGDASHEARVIVIDPIADASSGTFLVRLELPNPAQEIMGGVKCTAHFPTPARYGADPLERSANDRLFKENKPPIVPDYSAPQQSVSVETERPPMALTEPNDSTARSTNSGYIVLTPEFAGQAERRELVAALRASGIDDFMEMFAGPYAGRISMGTYNGPIMANRRSAQLAQLGFETTVVSRDRISTGLAEHDPSPGASVPVSAQDLVAAGSMD